MSDDEPTRRLTEPFDDRLQALPNVCEALALRWPEVHRVLSALREPGRIVVLQPFQRLAFPRAKVDFA